jgi:hypothetical protein
MVPWVTRLKMTDFLLGEVVKTKIFTRKPRTIEDLKTCIEDTFDNIDKDCEFRAYVILSIMSSLQNCISLEGCLFLILLSSRYVYVYVV